MVDAIDALDPFLTSIRPDDNQWRQDLATKIADVRAVHQELKDMKEPAEMIHIHSLLLAATGDCDQSMENLTKGLITGLDVEAMKKANELMRTCGEKMREPRRMLEEYLAAHDSRK
ncbi:MAG: hypothetical protein BroJett011_04200 [Chloroflexota bacterium]|nr:MAG: hypothetical protein BroJett011_04200 [Chloroflexota bacterium]